MCGRHKKAVENKKDDAASFIVAADLLLITTAVDPHEGQDVAIFDILG